MDSPAPSDVTALPIPGPLPTAPNWRWWLRRLLVCNPFFLVSAALLLFAINRLSLDPAFLGGEEPKLFFNFGTLQVYGGLLALTAALLARRQIWYDSSLLVVMEHGLVLVPFILIGQAALIGQGLAAALITAGAVAVALRAWVISRWFPSFNLPNRALLLGAGILVLNVIVPLWFRSVVDQQSVHDWVGPNRWLWLLALPGVAAAANLLPRPARFDGPNPESPWLPLLIYAFWFVGTGVHAASVGYLGTGSSLTLPLATPALVAAAWTVLNRLGDFLPQPSLLARRVAMGAIALVPVLAWREPSLLLATASFNFMGFGLLAFRGRAELKRHAAVLAAVSAGLALLGLPPEWITSFQPDWSRVEFALALLGLFTLVASGFSRHPGIGLAAGVIVFVGWQQWTGGRDAWQLGLATVLAHSLRWQSDLQGTAGLRWTAAGLWLLATYADATSGNWNSEAQSLGLLALAAMSWLLDRSAAAKVVALVGSIGLAVVPGRWLIGHLSAGTWALLASFVLFGIGAWFAWHRRQPGEQPARSVPAATD